MFWRTRNAMRHLVILQLILCRSGDSFILSTSLSSHGLSQLSSKSALYSSRAAEKKPKAPKPNKEKKSKQEKETKKLINKMTNLGRRGRSDEALDLYHRSPHHSTRLMNVAIDVCARARPPRLAQAFELFAAGRRSADVTPNVFTFGALTSVCARARDADRAVELLEVMERDYGVRPNGIVYSTVLSACERSRPPRTEMALELLDKARNDGEVSISVVGYNTVISTLARGGDWESAVDILNKMEEEGVQPDGVTYGTIMTACERAGRWQEVLDYASFCANNLALDGIMMTSALKACQQLGMATEALLYLDKMKHLGEQDRFGSRKTRGRERFGVRKPLSGPDDVAYCLAISACGRAGRWQDSLSLLREMTEQQGLTPSVNAYTAVISACADSGEYQMALQLWDDMKSKQHQIHPTVVTYSAVISACANAMANSPNSNQEIMESALRIFSELQEDENCTPNIITYNAMIKVCAEGLNLSQAFQFMTELTEEKGLTPTIVTFGTLMTACERVGNLSAASKVFSLMSKYDITPNEIVYGAAISCCRKAKEPKKAFVLLRKMVLHDKLNPNTATFNTVILSYTKAHAQSHTVTPDDVNHLSKAITVFKFMLTTATKPDSQTFTILIRALLQDQRPQDAETLLTYMTQNRNMKPEVYLYTGTIQAYEQTGRPGMALRMMEKMRMDGYDFYENQVLNAAFKKIVKIVNRVVKKKD